MAGLIPRRVPLPSVRLFINGTRKVFGRWCRRLSARNDRQGQVAFAVGYSAVPFFPPSLSPVFSLPPLPFLFYPLADGPRPRGTASTTSGHHSGVRSGESVHIVSVCCEGPTTRVSRARTQALLGGQAGWGGPWVNERNTYHGGHRGVRPCGAPRLESHPLQSGPSPRPTQGPFFFLFFFRAVIKKKRLATDYRERRQTQDTCTRD